MRKVKYVPQNETSTALLRSPLNRNVPLSKKAVAWTFPNSFVILYLDPTRWRNFFDVGIPSGILRLLTCTRITDADI